MYKLLINIFYSVGYFLIVGFIVALVVVAVGAVLSTHSYPN